MLESPKRGETGIPERKRWGPTKGKIGNARVPKRGKIGIPKWER